MILISLMKKKTNKNPEPDIRVKSERSEKQSNHQHLEYSDKVEG